MALNHKLYAALVELFEKVQIHNEGDPLSYCMQRGRINITDGGEEYRVCCPICADSRYRLYFNHMWGQKVDGKTLFGVHCFNEECQKKPKFFESVIVPLKDAIYGIKGRVVVAKKPIEQAHAATFVEVPDGITFLSDLPPGHYCKRYLSDKRGFNPEDVCSTWGLFYIPDGAAIPGSNGKFFPANHNLAIPCMLKNKIVSYQTRFINPLTLSDKPSGKYPPKYFTVGAKSSTVYNIDRADGEVIVLVEGPFDTWRVGHNFAISPWGKSLSAHQEGVIVRLLLERAVPLVVWLDQDAREEAEALVDRFKSKLTSPVLCCSTDMDPGKMAYNDVMNCLETVLGSA